MISDKTMKEELPMPVNTLAEYFKDLHNSCSSSVHTYNMEFIEDDILDSKISKDEIRSAIKSLKVNKAPGIDHLPPSLFKAFDNSLVSFLSKLFNSAFDAGTFPRCWSLGYIKPFFKKGDRMNPNNYRGITVLPVMGKIFTSIFHERLMFWCENYEILPDAQFGFRKYRSTTDALFVMSTISEWFKKQRAPLFTAFIDFAKLLTQLIIVIYGTNYTDWELALRCCV